MLKTYENFSGDELEIAERIQQRRLQLLVHSCLYYEMDTNIISDMKWDKWARELVSLQAQYPEISEKVIWYEAFKDWDASTGAFLPLKDPWVVQKAKMFVVGATERGKKKVVNPTAVPKPKKPKTASNRLF